MGNVVTPSFSSQSPSVNVKKYNYGGSPVSKPQLFEYTDMPEIDYSNPPKPIDNSTIPVEQVDTRLRIGASIVNTGVSVLKGLTSFGEALYDTGALINGAKQSLITLSMDLFNMAKSKVKGESYPGFKNTRSLWMNDIMPSIGVNYTEKIFDKIYYNTSFGRTANNMAFDCCKKDGLVCEIGEGIGYYTGVVALATVTAGVGGAAMSIPTSVAHGMVMGGAAIGRNTQSSYNRLSDVDKYRSGSLAKIVGISTVTGAVEGLTYFAGVEGANKAYGILSNKGVNVIASKTAKAGIQAVVKSFKPVVNSLIESGAYGIKINKKELVIQVVSVFASEAVGAVVETKVSDSLTAKKTIQQIANKYGGVKNGPNIATITSQADSTSTQAFKYFMDDQIIYAATEWSEGATQELINKPPEYLDAA